MPENKKDTDYTAAIHFRNLELSDPNSYGNGLIKHGLAEQGVGLVLIPNKNAYNFEEGTVSVLNTGDGDEVVVGSPLQLQLGDELQAIRARLLTPKELKEKVAVFNGPDLRNIGASKFEQYLLAEDFMPRSVLVLEDKQPNFEMFEAIPGQTFAIKGDFSQASQHLKFVDRSEALNAIFAMRQEFAAQEINKGKKVVNKSIIVQEFLKGEHWPTLQGIDDDNQNLLDGSDNTELRMYCFVDAAGKIPEELRFFGVARDFRKDGDDWVYVKQDSIPRQAYDIVDKVSTKLLGAADFRAGYMAVDLFYGPVSAQSGDSIYIREINTRDPMMVDVDENLEIAGIQRAMFANLMAVAAREVV